MIEAYTVVGDFEEFAAARKQFTELIERLVSAETAELEHGEVEELISAEGMELLRRLLQGHLEVRASREVKREEVHGSDGVVRWHCRRGCQRGLESLFGRVEVRG